MELDEKVGVRTSKPRKTHLGNRLTFGNQACHTCQAPGLAQAPLSSSEDLNIQELPIKQLIIIPASRTKLSSLKPRATDITRKGYRVTKSILAQVCYCPYRTSPVPWGMMDYLDRNIMRSSIHPYGNHPAQDFPHPLIRHLRVVVHHARLGRGAPPLFSHVPSHRVSIVSRRVLHVFQP